MTKTLGTLVWLILFLLFVPNNWVSAQDIKADIQLIETLEIDPAADFQITPRSFCGTEEDNIFLFADYKAGTIKILSYGDKSLKFLGSLGRNGLEKGKFGRPMYCFYNQTHAKLGVIDYGAKRIYIYDRTGMRDFTLGENFEYRYLGYDIEFTERGDQVVVPAYLPVSQNESYDLYSINVNSGAKSYLLDSYLKYGLKNHNEFTNEYFKKQTLPSIGIKSFIDISGDNLYFIWEGALRIIKLKLKEDSLKVGQLDEQLEKTVFKPKSDQLGHYKAPQGEKYALHYRKGEFKDWKEQKNTAAYAVNVFATPQYVYLFYMVKERNEKKDKSKMRMQVYTPEGTCLTDESVPGNPRKAMWMDKSQSKDGICELYVLSEKESINGKAPFSVLKYKINMNSGSVNSRSN